MWRDNLHTVCHLGGRNHSLPLATAEVIEAGEAVDKGDGNEDREVSGRAKDGDVEGTWANVKGWRGERLSFAYFSLPRQRKVGAAPHSNALNLSPHSIKQACTRDSSGASLFWAVWGMSARAVCGIGSGGSRQAPV